MRSSLLLVVIQLAAVSYTFSQGWDKTYNHLKDNVICSVYPTTNGGFFATGSIQEADTFNLYLIKTKADGDTIWTKSLALGGNVTSPYGEQTKDGGYIICSRVLKADLDIAVIKTDSLGNIQWQNTITGSEDQVPSRIHETQDGGYILAGSKCQDYMSGNGCLAFVVKLNSAGIISWTRNAPDTRNYRTFDIVEVNRGEYVVAGETFDTNDFDGFLFNLSESGTTTNLHWIKNLAGVPDRFEGFRRLVKVADGSLVLAGYASNSTGLHDGWLVKVDFRGEVLWTRSFGGGGHDYFFSLDTTNDGGYILGLSDNYTSATNDVFAIMKLNASGFEEWSKFYTWWAGKMDGSQVRQVSDGSFIISGARNEYNGINKGFLIKTDLFGNAPLAVSNTNEQPRKELIYPNPFTTTTTISLEQLHLDNNNASIQIFDILGNEVTDQADYVIERGINGSLLRLNRKSLSSGIYLYKIEHSSKVISGKLIVN